MNPTCPFCGVEILPSQDAFIWNHALGLGTSCALDGYNFPEQVWRRRPDQSSPTPVESTGELAANVVEVIDAELLRLHDLVRARRHDSPDWSWATRRIEVLQTQLSAALFAKERSP